MHIFNRYQHVQQKTKLDAALAHNFDYDQQKATLSGISISMAEPLSLTDVRSSVIISYFIRRTHRM